MYVGSCTADLQGTSVTWVAYSSKTFIMMATTYCWLRYWNLLSLRQSNTVIVAFLQKELLHTLQKFSKIACDSSHSDLSTQVNMVCFRNYSCQIYARFLKYRRLLLQYLRQPAKVAASSSRQVPEVVLKLETWTPFFFESGKFISSKSHSFTSSATEDVNTFEGTHKERGELEYWSVTGVIYIGK